MHIIPEYKREGKPMYIAPINANCAFYCETDDQTKKKYVVMDSDGNEYSQFDTPDLAQMAVNVLQTKLMAKHLKQFPPTEGTYGEENLKRKTT